MSWFGKKQKGVKRVDNSGLPELPPLKDDFGLDKRFEPRERTAIESYSQPMAIKNELPPLPAFSQSSSRENMVREISKVEVPEMPEDEERNEKKKMTREISEAYDESFIPQPSFSPKREYPPLMKNYEAPKKSVEQIYVRIDKYQESLAEFSDIKKKIQEIESLLLEIKELKAKEEFELQEWEREMREAKNKMEKIDSTLFKSLED